MKYLSGIRPTGRIHLGNYLGAIKHWVDIQNAGNNCKFFIADLHGDFDFLEQTLPTMKALEKLGINKILRQSDFKDEILAMFYDLMKKTSVGQLSRMTQYKDKKDKDCSLFLLSYPVLMAADIFYFGGTRIPVGEDQKQHIEFVRDLADKLGYDKPEPIIYNAGCRIMSLTDAAKKMSKSDGNNDGCIYMDDTPEEVERKIKGAKTSMNFSDNTPEANNLKEIYYCLKGRHPEFDRWPDFKKELTQEVIKVLI